jgi:hypothetical protein
VTAGTLILGGGADARTPVQVIQLSLPVPHAIP